MRVSKWGHSLAVRLPRQIVKELRLAPGDELAIVKASHTRIALTGPTQGGAGPHEKAAMDLAEELSLRSGGGQQAVSAFFDTNILVCAQQNGAKADKARALLAAGGILSVQVLNEFAAVAHLL